MSRITIKHNPYTIETTIMIDGNVPSEDSDLSVLVYNGQRIGKWISMLPECLSNEYDEDEYDFEYFGIKEDYSLVKQSLEEADCVDTIEYKGGYYEIEELEEFFASIAKDIADNSEYADERIQNIQTDCLSHPVANNTQERINRLKQLHQRLKEYVAEQLDSECSEEKIDDLEIKLQDLEEAIDDKEEQLGKRISQLDKCYEIKKVDFSSTVNEAIGKYIGELAHRTKTLQPKKSEYFVKSAVEENFNLYAAQLHDVFNAVNQSVASDVQKIVDSTVKQINKSRTLLDNLEIDNLQIGQNLPKLQLQQIQCNPIDYGFSDADDAYDERALEKARKAKKAAKIIGGVSAVAISPIGAVAAVATNAVANKYANANGVNARKFFVALADDMKERSQSNHKVIEEYCLNVAESVNKELFNLIEEKKQALESQEREQLDICRSDLKKSETELDDILRKENWLLDVASRAYALTYYEKQENVQPQETTEKDFLSNDALCNRHKRHILRNIDSFADASKQALKSSGNERQTAKIFEMSVEDATVIENQGISFLGKIVLGRIYAEDKVSIVFDDGNIKSAEVAGVAALVDDEYKILDYAEINDEAEVLIRDFDASLKDRAKKIVIE